MKRSSHLFPLFMALVIGLPLLGVTLAGKSLGAYAEFPPLTRHVAHAAFSWPVFGALALSSVALLVPFGLRMLRQGARAPGPRSLSPVAPFPWWGWLGLGFGACAWVLAWTRFPWFGALQRHTFTPLWIAYIVVVNALTCRRTGRCLMTDRPREFFLLFVASAGFWWFFEYLNRFVQNWYYVGIGNMSRGEYFFFATLPFSTVLPAVISTAEWLDSFSPGPWEAYRRCMPLKVAPRPGAWVGLVLACAGLAGLGVWPDALFPLLWLAPLAILVALQTLAGRATVLSSVREGDWRAIVRFALAALICGFFWEMWNYRSLAKWIYAVPCVNRFQVFEMPVLGYIGYLPFGLECAVIAGLVAQRERPAAGVALGARWRRRSVRLLVQTALFIAGVSFLPFLWCSRGAAGWYAGEAGLQAKLARGVEGWVTRDMVRGDFATGSRQFDGEWLFGTYLMAGLGFVQTEGEHPELRERNLRLAQTCIARLVTPEVRAFDRETWGSDPLDTLDGKPHHAAYLGYLNLLLGLHRQLDPQSPYAELNDRISAALQKRMERSPLGLLESYPTEIYPVDNCAVLASLAVHARVSGTDRRDFLERGLRNFRERCVSRATGLLYQAVDSATGAPVDQARGSGTCLGLYFLSFADRSFSGELYGAVKKQLAGTVFGFGGVREYPRGEQAGARDIDSGPVAFGFGLSPTGFLIAGSRIHRDKDFFARLYATAYACGAPFERDGKLNFVTGASLGDAILFAMLTAGGSPGAEKEVTP